MNAHELAGSDRSDSDRPFDVEAAKARHEARGRKVREVWIEWAKEQPNPKPSWLVPYDELSEADQDVDKRIGSALYGDGFLDGVNFGLETAIEMRRRGVDARAGGRTRAVSATDRGQSGIGASGLDTPARPSADGSTPPAALPPSLPKPDWGDEQVLAEPWSIVCDALIYQHAGVPLPDELSEAAEHAGMILTSLALIRTGEYDIDDMDAMWDRDELEWRFSWAEADESLCVEAVFTDGNEPALVKTTARGLGGKLNEFMLSHAATSQPAVHVTDDDTPERDIRPNSAHSPSPRKDSE